ncbi:MAG TPA: ATP-binding protein [Burkholderiales bacterium]|nr:ATP-binding protein [Burkholderiales bacterium]
MMRSLNARLLILLLGVILCVWIATVLFTWFDARHEIDELLDGHLAQAAALLIAQTSHDVAEIDVEHAPLLHKDARKVAFQIWEQGRHLRLHSVNAPSVALSNDQSGFSDSVVDGTRWRVFSTWDRSREFLVQVGERADVRAQLARDIAKALLAPLLIALPLLGGLIWLAIRLGLRPLSNLADEVSRRSPDNLKAIDAPTLPSEAAPLVARLNTLLARIQSSLERERRFTADAAHELRTPIAALKAQAQVARMAGDEAGRTHAIDQVIAGADRAGRLVEQMLTLARLEQEHREQWVSCDLSQVAREVIAELAPSAIEKGIAIELTGDDSVRVSAIPGLVHVLMRNLIDNAARHSPPGSRVEVAVQTRAGGAELLVTDNGPGIPAAERAKVFDRFHRLAEAGEGGSGLGLSIVQRIAQIHAASVELRDAPQGQGLQVRVIFVDGRDRARAASR